MFAIIGALAKQGLRASAHGLGHIRRSSRVCQVYKKLSGLEHIASALFWGTHSVRSLSRFSHWLGTGCRVGVQRQGVRDQHRAVRLKTVPPFSFGKGGIRSHAPQRQPADA